MIITDKIEEVNTNTEKENEHTLGCPLKLAVNY